MTNLEIAAIKDLEARSLQIEVIECSGEVVAASPEYWEALNEFNTEYPAIAGLISEYEEDKKENEQRVINSLLRSFYYSGTTTIVGAVCPPLALAGLVGVGLTMLGLLKYNPNK
jgi:hypothetical protein